MSFSHLSRSLRIGGCFAASAAVMLLCTTSAFAQALPGSAQAGRVESQIDKQQDLGATTNEVSVPEIRIEGAPQGADNIRFTLKTLTVEGINAYNPAEIQAIYANDLGQTITLTRLYEIAGEITRKYRNDGYIISQTVVPAQTIASGDAKLLVVEGSLDQVIVEGAVGDSDRGTVQAMADKLKASHPLKADALERYLLLINDLPGVSARSIIGPSPTQTGKADIRVIIERDPANFLLGGDNYGSAYLGPWQITGAAQLNNVFGQNDKFLAQMVTAPYDGELYYFYGLYERPIGTEGTTLGVDLSYSDTEPGYDIRIFGAEGFATTLGATVKHPFIRSRNENLTARARIEAKTNSTRNDLGVSTDDDIRSIRVGARYELLSTLIGTSVNMVDAQVSHGLDIWNASSEGDSDLSRLSGDPQYTKFEAEITRLQRIVQDLNVLVGVKGQKSNKPLLSSEEFGVGGMGYGYGRGYDPSEVIGDDGVAAKVEVQWNTHVFDNTIQSLQLFGFYDVGAVWNKDATTADDKKNSIASAGIGARARITPAVSADVTMAVPLTADVATERDTNPRFFASLSTRF